jgi:hypothetical protein
MMFAPATRRRLWFALALVAGFTLTGFWVLPPIVKTQLERRLSAELGRPVTVGRVRINPYALSLTVEDFTVREPGGEADFIAWRRLYVRFGAWASLRGEWVLSAVALDGFKARAVVNRDQSLNFSDLLAKFSPPAPSAVPPAPPGRPVRVADLRVTEAQIDFSDLSRPQPFHTQIGPLTFAVSGLRTAGATGAPYRFEAITESGENLAWSGTLQAVPFRSVGELHLDGIMLPKYAPYYADRLRADLVAGQLSVGGRYELDLTPGHRALKLSEGAVQLRGLQLRDRVGTGIAIDLPSLDIGGVQVDGISQKVAVRAITIAGGQIHLVRARDGAINLIGMLPEPAAAPRRAGANGPARLPDLTVDDVAWRDLNVDLSDLAAPRPAHLAMSRIQGEVKHLSLAPDAPMPVSLAFAWAPGGTLRVAGEMGIDPLRAVLKVDAADFAILPLSPYLEQWVDARVTQGTVTASIQAEVAPGPGQSLAATLAGDITVGKFGLVSGMRGEELAGFGELALHGLRARTAPPLGIDLADIELSGPYARVTIAADKTMNLATVLRPRGALKGEGAAGAPASAPGGPPPAITIGKIGIEGGDFRFTDRSIEPNVRIEIAQFGGTIGGLSSAHPAKADVALTAMVDGAGPVSIGGGLDPLGPSPSVDLKIGVKNVDLVPFSAYSGRYAGYELARGKLALAVAVAVSGRKIDAANVITLNQFTFGDAVKSAEATGLPVRLGVALLKDIDGKMVIDVPVQGSLDDPDFRVGRVVLRVIVNLLTKAAVSPFALLGSAFGGGGDELAYQDFAPGSAEISPAGVPKLQTMVRALTQRPGLSLGLEGSYDGAADAYALKRRKLDRQLRREIWAAKHLADPNIAPPDELAIAPAEFAAAIKKRFDAAFPPGTQFGTPLPPPPAIVSPPPPPAGLLRRALRLITFQAPREQREARKENARLTVAHDQAVAAATAAGLPTEEMRGRLAEAVTVDANDLRALAQARAQTVRDYFAGEGKIAGDRLFLTRATAAVDLGTAGRGPRVFLELQ